MESKQMRTIAKIRPRDCAMRITRGLVALTLGAGLTIPSGAAVIDDFENGVKFSAGGGDLDYFAWKVTGGQLVVANPSPVPSTLNNALLTYDSAYWSVPSFADILVEDRTLELRVDIVHASADDLFSVLICKDSADGVDYGYVVAIDRNEVALIKYRGGDLTILFWDTLPTDFRPVTLTARLALRKTESGVLITATVMDTSRGEILYERPFTDGPGQDGPMPPPNPHGIGPLTPDEGAPYTNFGYAEVGVLQIMPTEPPPLEVRLDNLEYDVYALEITNSVLLSWSPNMPGEQIVVGADAIEGPYAPVPEPMFERFGSLCVAVPTTAHRQFFTHVRGTQFMDGFSEPKQPSANRLLWDMHWKDPNDEITVENGVLHLRRLGFTATAGLLLRPPEEVVVRDFAASLDIVGFTATDNKWCAVFIALNCVFRDNGGSVEGNGAGLVFNSDVLGRVSPRLFNGHQELSGQPFDIAVHPPPYRLEFSGVGSELRYRVVHLATKATLSEQEVPRTAFFEGWIGLFTNNDADSNTHDLTVDNFFVAGTRPAGTAP